MASGLRYWVGACTVALALVACENSESTPESSVQVTVLKTEFRAQSGDYVACNTVTYPDGTLSAQTALAVHFVTDKVVETATVSLKGQPTSQYDAFYIQSVLPNQLNVLQGGVYRLLLSANATSALYLSEHSRVQALAVRPTSDAVKVKTVRAAYRQEYSFYSKVTVNSAGISSNSRSEQSIPVYDACTVLFTNVSDTL